MAGPANPQNVYQQSAGAYQGALGGTAAAGMGPNIAQFQNPFTSQVINQSQSDLERQRQMATNTMGAQATAAGAFGGARHGVADALTNEGFARTGADMASGLRMQGFDTALQAGQAQQGLGLQAAGQLGSLSNLGFGFGQQIGQAQSGQGALQQAIQQQLIDAARGQYGGFTSAPQQSIQLPMAAVSGANMGQQTQTTSKQPGLFDYLGMGASLAGAFCWVAREVYGPENVAWVQFREWLLEDAPKWLRNAYIKHGERFAGVVRRAPVLKRLLRPMMDAARRSRGY